MFILFTVISETAVKLLDIQKPLSPFSEIPPTVFNPIIDPLPMTVMVTVAVLPPSCVVAVRMALPAAIPVTRPRLLTVATEVLSELQLTVLLEASAGETVAVSCCVISRGMLAEGGLTLTPVTKVDTPLLSA